MPSGKPGGIFKGDAFLKKVFFAAVAGDSYREQSEAAHSLLIKELATFLCCNESGIVIKKDRKGKPFVAGRDDIFISISHTKGAVMVGFSDSPIGVDIEQIKTRRKSVENRVFTSGESTLIDASTDENKAFFTLWTLKESYLKAVGTGFADNAKEIEFFSLSNPVKSNSEQFSFETGVWQNCAFSICN